MVQLSRRQRKLFKSRLFLFLSIVIGLIILFSVGFPLLINSSLYVSQLFGGKKDTTENLSEALGTLEIDSLPVATNSARIIVTGNVENFDELYFYINDQEVKNVQPDETFEEEIGDLQPGDNEIYLIAVNKKTKKKKETPKYTVVYKTGKPKLEILEPVDNSKTSRDEINVTGKTDKDVNLQINSIPVTIDANGNFKTSIRLKEGENKITVRVEDSAGNFEEKILTLTYEKD